MYSGLKQANQIKGNSGSKSVKNAALRVAFLQSGHLAAVHPDSLQKQTVLSSTSGYYYIDGIAVSATDTEESILYGEQYEWADSYY